MAIRRRRHGRAAAGCGSVEARQGLGDADDGLPVDELLLAACCLAQGGGGEPVDLAQRSLGQLVEGGERVVGEERSVGTGRSEAVAEVLGRIVEGGGREEEAVVDAGEQRAMSPS